MCILNIKLKLTTPTPTKTDIVTTPTNLSVTKTRKAEGELRHVISIIGIDTSTINNEIFSQGMKHIDEFESISEDQM